MEHGAWDTCGHIWTHKVTYGYICIHMWIHMGAQAARFGPEHGSWAPIGLHMYPLCNIRVHVCPYVSMCPYIHIYLYIYIYIYAYKTTLRMIRRFRGEGGSRIGLASITHRSHIGLASISHRSHIGLESLLHRSCTLI